MDVSGSAVVYGGMNVVGNADICGNVLLTSGSSAVQQVHIRATTASTDTTGGRWWRWGGDKREGEHKRQYGRVELFCRGLSQQSRIGSGNAGLHVGFHDGGFYIKYIKRDERFNWIRIRFD
jgi:hypothetical protein